MSGVLGKMWNSRFKRRLYGIIGHCTIDLEGSNGRYLTSALGVLPRSLCHQRRQRPSLSDAVSLSAVSRIIALFADPAERHLQPDELESALLLRRQLDCVESLRMYVVNTPAVFANEMVVTRRGVRIVSRRPRHELDFGYFAHRHKLSQSVVYGGPRDFRNTFANLAKDLVGSQVNVRLRQHFGDASALYRHPPAASSKPIDQESRLVIT